MSIASDKTQTNEKAVSLNNMEDVADLYDESTDCLEHILGDHIHHGFYDVGTDLKTVPLESAMLRMVEESLRFAGLSGKKLERIVDVGCGIGGCTRYIGKKYGVETIGITNSLVQVQRAQAISDAKGISDPVTFEFGDALNLSFPDGHFDLVWSMESGEHMSDRAKYLSELVRVAAPGGTIILTYSSLRELSPGEVSLKADEKELLNKICTGLHLSEWCPSSVYVNLLKSHKVKDLKTADWTENASLFWPAFFSIPFNWETVKALLRSGPQSHEFLLNMELLHEGQKKGVLKYNIVTCKKPE